MMWNVPPEVSESTPLAAAAAPSALKLDSLFDYITAGGHFMWPIGLCSVVALMYVVERWLRLRPSLLGTARFGRDVVSAVKAGGPAAGLDVCHKTSTSLGRILATGLRLWSAPFVEREKAVEDAGVREVKNLSANLKPLVIVSNLSPLLGLLGTVWGLTMAFMSIGKNSGLGKPEELANGIAQALITTIAGLVVAVPALVAYHWLKAKVDRLARRAEDVYAEVCDAARAATATPAVAVAEVARAN
jgi:biopolymer transport protein ExbB